MKLTLDNYKNYVKDEDQRLMGDLLYDLEEFNNILDNLDESYLKLYINFVDEHTEYSAERTDPCPDYYGYYTLNFEDDEHKYDTVGGYMSIDEIDTALCVLINFMEVKL